MKGWKSHSPTPKQPRQLRRVVGAKKVTATAHPRRPGRRGVSARAGGRGAGQGPRGTRGGRSRSAPATASSSLPPFLPLPAGMQRGGPGEQVCSARACPRSEAASAAPRRPGPARPRPARPPRALTLRAVVESVELPVRGQGLQRHRRRPRQRPPLTQAHGTSYPAPAPHAGK